MTVITGDFRDYECPGDASLVLVDPPYGLGKTYAEKKEVATFDFWVSEILSWSTAPRTMIFSPTPTLYEWLPRVYRPSRFLWWHRTFVQPTKGLKFWLPSITPILVYEKEGAPWYGPTNNDRAFHDVIDSHSAMADAPRLKRLQAPKHPGVTGTQIAKKIIGPLTQEGDLVVDPMAGVGSIPVAAAMLGRRCWGVEIDDGYADVARRWVAENL